MGRGFYYEHRGVEGGSTLDFGLLRRDLSNTFLTVFVLTTKVVLRRPVFRHGQEKTFQSLSFCPIPLRSPRLRLTRSLPLGPSQVFVRPSSGKTKPNPDVVPSTQ